MNREEIFLILMDICEKITFFLMELYLERLVSVCVFGSVARKTFNENSDIDLLVIIENAPTKKFQRFHEILPLMNRIYALEEYEQIEKYTKALEPSFIILTREEIKKHPPILLDISQDAIIIYDKNDFLANELENIRKRLKELGSIKKYTSHGHYWVLKPDIKPGEVVEI